MSKFENIADEIIAKKPELRGIRAQLVEEVSALDELVESILSTLREQKAAIVAMLALAPAADPEIREQTIASFAFWGISLDKFQAFFGLSGVDDIAKFVALTLKQGDTSVEKESIKSFMIARLKPEFGVLVAA